MPELKRSTDPVCAKKQMKDEEVVTKGGKLANVLVRIVGAPATEPPTTPVTLVQEDCMYRPRVMGIVAGQPLSIKNADATLHNIHTYKGASTLFNVAQVPNSPNIEKKLTDAGALLKLKCDVHQWMTAYIWVQNNPYFAVTGDDGKFTIKDVPAGKYEIVAWQERFGEKKGEVTIAPDKTAEVKFDYTGAETAAK
jgi:plastocyanin